MVFKGVLWRKAICLFYCGRDNDTFSLVEIKKVFLTNEFLYDE